MNVEKFFMSLGELVGFLGLEGLLGCVVELEGLIVALGDLLFLGILADILLILSTTNIFS